MSKRILVTSALPYANGPIHLGHLAGAYLPADLYTRFQRLNQKDIIHISGSDEHGVPITIAAEKEGVTPNEIVERYHTRNKSVFEKFGIDFDYYGRTSSDTHRKTSQDFFLNLHEQGVFSQKKQEQFYDEEADMFLPDRYVKGTCPVCGHPEAFGDQCEKCGSSLSPTDLIDPVSAITGNKPVIKETDHWFIPLGDFQPWLDEWIGSRNNWKANVVGQCKSWLDAGLGDRAVTRDLNWGVPVPLPEGEGKVLYVWFDAPIGYISATKEWAEEQGNPELWKTYWQDEETSLIHFIGKDNIVFHCIMFPAMLKQHGDFVLPENVPANEFLNLEGRKLSTSKGWAVWLEEYLEDFEADLLRYVLGTTLPETKDSDFSWKDFQSRVNSELADILGNFVFRTTSFTHRFFDGQVPAFSNPSDLDLQTLKEIEAQKKKIEQAYNSFKFREAIAETMHLARIGNRYFTETEP
jgi:methionyl-tRNA synthetase